MIYLTQLIYLHPGKEQSFHEFEGGVFPLLGKYHGELLLRIRPQSDGVVNASIEVPYEIHFVRFKSEEDFLRFSRDEERERILHLKRNSVRSVLLVKGTSV